MSGRARAKSRSPPRSHHDAGLTIMQSIFSPAERRQEAEPRGESGGRDGELKMDWTEPLYHARPMGIECLAEG